MAPTFPGNEQGFPRSRGNANEGRYGEADQRSSLGSGPQGGWGGGSAGSSHGGWERQGSAGGWTGDTGGSVSEGMSGSAGGSSGLPGSAPWNSAGGFGGSGAESSVSGGGVASGGNNKSSTPLSYTSGSWTYLAVAIVAAVIGVVLGILAPTVGGSATDTGFKVLSTAGWVLCGFVSFIFLGIHTAVDTRKQAESFYIENESQVTAYRGAAIVALVGVVITAVEIALSFSKAVGAS